MDFSVYMILGATGSIMLLLGAVLIQALRNRRWPSNDYTPFDYITAQSKIEFHDVEQDNDDDDDHGDDKNKNEMKRK
ncbi:DUF3951 domain-containing protein [Paenibacillus aurantiacus]|uniref:DUF3951 domain-containing protein n=1 Tax=Paenibacillus aurantiacus TaxID=1936118 RepID=A0ABV5KQ25_9BACL